MNLALTGKRVLVTGGSRGIGRAIALELAGLGAVVGVNYAASAAAAESVVRSIVESGGGAVALKGDVSTASGAEGLVASALTAFGGLDILVNNAGITRDTLALRLSEDDWNPFFDTNLKGLFFCAKAALRGMLRQRSGRIVNISSVVGISGNAGQANYSAAKAGMIGLTKSLAREAGSRGVTVNAVAPGFIETDMTAALSELIREGARSSIPLARFGTPEDVASAVAFLCSDSAGYITGAVLQVDGGLAM